MRKQNKPKPPTTYSHSPNRTAVAFLEAHLSQGSQTQGGSVHKSTGPCRGIPLQGGDAYSQGGVQLSSEGLRADTEVGLSHQCLGSRGLVRRENPFNQEEPAISSSREREADFSQIREKFLL